jgi:hypothetical protein
MMSTAVKATLHPGRSGRTARRQPDVQRGRRSTVVVRRNVVQVRRRGGHAVAVVVGHDEN